MWSVVHIYMVLGGQWNVKFNWTANNELYSGEDRTFWTDILQYLQETVTDVLLDSCGKLQPATG